MRTPDPEHCIHFETVAFYREDRERIEAQVNPRQSLWVHGGSAIILNAVAYDIISHQLDHASGHLDVFVRPHFSK